MTRQTRKTFITEFKREAVRLLEQGDKEAAQLARELGVRRNQLYKWKAEIDERGAQAFPGKDRGARAAKDAEDKRKGKRRGQGKKEGSSIIFTFYKSNKSWTPTIRKA